MTCFFPAAIYNESIQISRRVFHEQDYFRPERPRRRGPLLPRQAGGGGATDKTAPPGGDPLYTSGQLGLIPATGELPQGVEAQAAQALDNLKAVLAAAGMGLEDVVKTTVFLADMNDFAAINAVYAKYFPGEAPARSCVQVAALPKGGLFEIEAVAVR